MTLACVVATMNTIIMGLPVQRAAVAVVTAAVAVAVAVTTPIAYFVTVVVTKHHVLEIAHGTDLRVHMQHHQAAAAAIAVVIPVLGQHVLTWVMRILQEWHAHKADVPGIQDQERAPAHLHLCNRHALV